MGFLLFPIDGLLMGLCLAALRAAGAPLSTWSLTKFITVAFILLYFAYITYNARLYWFEK